MRIGSLPILAAIGTTWFVWGGTYLALAIALEDIPPLLLMGSRSVVGGIILLCISGDRSRLASWRRIPQILACGLFLFVGCHGVLAVVEQHVPSGIAAVMLATIPLWMALMKFTIGAPDRPSALQLALLVPGLAGVALVTGLGGPGSLGGSDAALLLVASASWAAGSLVSIRWARDVDARAFSGASLVSGGLVLLAVAAVLGETSQFDATAVRWPAIAAWLILTLAGSVLAMLAYMWLLRRLKAEFVATYTFVNPVVALLLGWWLRDEQPTWIMAAGAALVIGSVAGQLLLSVKQRELRAFTRDEDLRPAAVTDR